MPTFKQDRFDSIVSDPPYGLSFMGKDWDHGVPGEAFWREALRVAKPGAHLLAFGGTRTFHRLAVAIENAGWEIRDCVMWVYGSGFPKSLDVSKAIDRMDARYPIERKFKFTAWVRSQGVTARQIDDATGTFMGGHYTTHPTQPSIMTREHLEACRHLFADVPDWIEREVDVRTMESENMKRREVIGTVAARDTRKVSISRARTAQGIDEPDTREVPITAPATPEARAWEGWGTALKPAWEPVIVARKPLQGTVAENVLKYGTGAVNIDGCRVGGEKGRWPANVIHDGSEEVVAGFPITSPAQASMRGDRTGVVTNFGGSDTLRGHNDAGGSAARFFYCAKAGKADRDDGEVANHHPTVKPTKLMRYLVRLVTPKKGVVLDPFMGSGSTGRGAVLEGFGFVGIEQNAEYIEIARARIGKIANARIAQAKKTADYIKSLPVQMDLFDAMA